VNGLLTHTAGLPAQVNTPNSTPPDFRFPSREELFQLQAEQETLFPASTHYEYSNLGISLLGEIISILSGESFESYIQKQLLDPLNLNDTSASIPVEETGSRLAVGHSARQRDGRRSRVGPYDAKAYAPALGFASTVNDLAAFASWQFRVLGENDNKVIDANTLREMYRPHFMLPGWESAQGLGFEVDAINGTVYVGHSGTCPGYVSRLQIEPNTQIATIIMANANNVDVWNIATKMHEIFAPAIEEATASIGSTKNNDATPVKANIEPEQLQDYVGLYDVWPWNADTAFIAWKGQLSALRLSSINPVQDLRHWKHISGDVFRRIRSDGLLAEAWTFERDSSGNVVRVKVYGDYIKKIR
jgi:CubicO group peptidase (beta-lactamase class C family)